YPSGDPIKTSASRLADLMKSKIIEGLRVTMFGYSMGGLVNSFAIERRGGYMYVDSSFLVGTPRQGTDIAKQSDFCQGLRDDNLNNPNDSADHWGHVCDLNTPSVKDVVPNSPFMQEF